MRLKLLLAGFFAGFIISGCLGSDDDGPGLYYLGKNPLEIAKGDTTTRLEFKVIYTTDALRGKTKLEDNYTDIALESSDSTHAGISGLKIIGRGNAGDTAEVTARDNKSRLDDVEFVQRIRVIIKSN